MGSSSIRNHLIFLWITVWLLGSIALIKSESRKGRIHTEPEQLKHIQLVKGSEVTLRCGIRNSHSDYMVSSEIEWYFKPCGNSRNRTSCKTDGEKTWTRLNCDGSPCQPTLVIKSPSEANSGLYRCSMNPYRPDNRTVLGIHVVNTYQLDVVSSDPMDSPPEFLGFGANVSVPLDGTAVLPCKVYSRIPPSIRWFKKQDNTSNYPSFSGDSYTHVIQHLESTFESVESSGQKLVGRDTYLSKFIINHVTEEDSGFYVCVSMNYNGYRIQETLLHVMMPESQFLKNQFFLLFLIPVLFAIIPLSMWLCFLLSRRRQRLQAKDASQIVTTAEADSANIPLRNNTTILITNNYDNRRYTTLKNKSYWYYL
ncbi:fibroblast growth factor receptor-like 1 [Phlebotomus argentipes]|uniref:fibroblast growth factor receptor-like 1 n=1 Tax=Phlebotomus argentipes TaxID=94469 RepID=UPI0028932FFB|nr:fibroblast growth factor receptor-like 1 [Phlebotomus argentipes]